MTPFKRTLLNWFLVIVLIVTAVTVRNCYAPKVDAVTPARSRIGLFRKNITAKALKTYDGTAYSS